MPIIRNAAFESFLNVTRGPDWAGTRLKDVRDQSLVPGGRTHVTFFESVDDGRPHPRLQTSMPPAVDPDVSAAQWSGGDAFSSADAFTTALTAALATSASAFAGDDLSDEDAPKGSPQFYRHSIRTQRIARFFDGANQAIVRAEKNGRLPVTEATGARYARAEARDAPGVCGASRLHTSRVRCGSVG